MERSRNTGRSGGSAPRAQQERARDKCRLIIDAASTVISAHGITGLTHRLVAQQADLPLAATTYHFECKADIIRAAAKTILKSYDLSFSRALERFRERSGSPQAFLAYFTSLMQNTAGRARSRAICLGEIMLYAPRHAEELSVAQNWFARQIGIWRDIFAACNMDYPEQRAVVAIDVLIGLLLLVVGLGLTEGEISKIIAAERDLLDFRPPDHASRSGGTPVRDTAKAVATRAKILAATINVLKREGPGAVNCRVVADAAGLTKAAPYHYFPSVADLLAAAQQKLFGRSKERYRHALSEVGGVDLDFEHLIDRTAVVFLREATEYADECIANYSIWLRADGEPTLRAMIWGAAADQHIAWRNVLRRWKPELGPIDPLLAQALFLGKLVRILATGSRIPNLAGIRREFAFGLRDLASSVGLTPQKTVHSTKN